MLNYSKQYIATLWKGNEIIEKTFPNRRTALAWANKEKGKRLQIKIPNGKILFDSNANITRN